MEYLCSSHFNDYSELLKFARTLERKDILSIIPLQEGVIFKRYSYCILFYRKDM